MLELVHGVLLNIFEMTQLIHEKQNSFSWISRTLLWHILRKVWVCINSLPPSPTSWPLLSATLTFHQHLVPMICCLPRLFIQSLTHLPTGLLIYSLLSAHRWYVGEILLLPVSVSGIEEVSWELDHTALYSRHSPLRTETNKHTTHPLSLLLQYHCSTSVTTDCSSSGFWVCEFFTSQWLGCVSAVIPLGRTLYFF